MESDDGEDSNKSSEKPYNENDPTESPSVSLKKVAFPMIVNFISEFDHSIKLPTKYSLGPMAINQIANNLYVGSSMENMIYKFKLSNPPVLLREIETSSKVIDLKFLSSKKLLICSLKGDSNLYIYDMDFKLIKKKSGVTSNLKIGKKLKFKNFRF